MYLKLHTICEKELNSEEILESIFLPHIIKKLEIHLGTDYVCPKCGEMDFGATFKDINSHLYASIKCDNCSTPIVIPIQLLLT
jgi:transcription elongation factor Elf1